MTQRSAMEIAEVLTDAGTKSDAATWDNREDTYMQMDEDPHGIGAYYKRKLEESCAAWQRYDEAKARNAPEPELRKLRKLAEDAGYTGD